MAELPGRLVQHLRPRLVADDGLQVADDVGEGVRPHRAADDVVRGPDVRDPIPQRLVDGVLQRPAAALHRDHRGPELPHPEAVQLLALGVDLAHVDDTLQVQHRARGSRRDAVLPCTCLRDDTLLAELHGQQCLADGVIDLVGARMSQLLALEPDLGAAAHLGEAPCVVERCRPAYEVPSEPRQFGFELGVHLPLGPGLLELLVSDHERLWYEATAEDRALKVPLVCVLLHPLRLLSGLLPLRRRLHRLRRDGALQGPPAQLPDDLPDSCNTRLGDLRYNLGAHHAAVREGTELLDVLPLGDTETHYDRQLSARAAKLLSRCMNRVHDPLALLQALGLGVGCFGVAGTRGAEQRHHVDHAWRGGEGALGHLRDALWPARGRRERDETQLVVGGSGCHRTPGLLARKVDNNESVNSRSRALLARGLDAGSKESVVVAHEKHWHCQALLAGVLCVLDAVGVDGPVLYSHNASSFDRTAICHRVGEGHSQLDHVCALFLHLQHGWHGVRLGRIARRHKSHEGCAACIAACREPGSQPLGHGGESK
mmetsp:Transcript_40600/g.107613  ORF Transcript_40600/g.107613 Transcript_40600/m.107613 type:complete len:542 (+) Transcript_40600:798-2423(+)